MGGRHMRPVFVVILEANVVVATSVRAVVEQNFGDVMSIPPMRAQLEGKLPVFVGKAMPLVIAADVLPGFSAQEYAMREEVFLHQAIEVVIAGMVDKIPVLMHR